MFIYKHKFIFKYLYIFSARAYPKNAVVDYGDYDGEPENEEEEEEEEVGPVPIFSQPAKHVKARLGENAEFPCTVKDKSKLLHHCLS